MELKNKKLFQTGAFIDGEWIENGKTFEVVDPGTQEVIANVTEAGVPETERAIEAADRAFKSFRKTTALERSLLLRRWADLIEENKEDIAKIMVIEQGKAWSDAIGEVNYANSFLYWFSEEARRVYGDIIPPSREGTRVMTIKQPVGVVGLITPWNFPIGMLTRKLGPALATGCTVVVRPSSQVPLAANAIAALGIEAGVPKGVFNVVAGVHAIGDVMCKSKKVKKISFTGSTSVGIMLMKQCADTVKKVSMELGGNAPFLVFDDADLDKAVESAMLAKFRNTGQACIGANRIYVQEGVFDEFAKRFTAETKKIKLGHGTDKSVTAGPLINEKAVNDLHAFLDDAKSKGAKVLHGGNKSSLGPCYFEPTVISGCNDKMRVAHEELFGPIAPLFSFKDEAEAIEMANNTPFGLAAYCCTKDLGRAWRLSEELEAGLVGINEGLISNAAAPFGGFKESGLGREGSKYGIEDYVEIKYVMMGGI